MRPGGGVRLRSPRGSAPRLIVEAPMSAPIIHFITYYYYDYYYDYSTIHKSGGTDQTSSVSYTNLTLPTKRIV